MTVDSSQKGPPYTIRRAPRCRPVKLDWSENRLIKLYRDLPPEEQCGVMDTATRAWHAGWDARTLACQAPKRKRTARKAASGANVIAFPRPTR